MKNKKMLMVIMAFFVGVSGIVFTYNSEKKTADIEVAYNDEEVMDNSADDTGKDSIDDDKASLIYVYVCGCVNAPGMYSLEGGSRIADAIQKAGGLSQEADKDYLNQAMVISDGMKIYVPSVNETQESGYSAVNGTQESGYSTVTDDSVADSGKININKADKNELMSLSGIGQSKAEAIIEYREKNGSFEKIEDIKKVSGIKDALYGRICDYIEVD